MHEGHRQRLWEKLKQGDNLFEHELLEILLFNAYPRKNVNPVAHALLQRFSSINEVINADLDELMLVEGVGENVALYLKCIGECMRLKNNCSSFAVIKNNAEFRQFASARLAGRRTEALEFYLLDKGGDVKRICTFTDGDPESVVVRPDEVVKLISVYRPHGVYMAHNHVDCPCSPSAADDDMTKKVQMICSLNNVRFYDHCIFAPDGYYSYFMTNRLDEIAREFSVSNLFKNDL